MIIPFFHFVRIELMIYSMQLILWLLFFFFVWQPGWALKLNFSIISIAIIERNIEILLFSSHAFVIVFSDILFVQIRRSTEITTVRWNVVHFHYTTMCMFTHEWMNSIEIGEGDYAAIECVDSVLCILNACHYIRRMVYGKPFWSDN